MDEMYAELRQSLLHDGSMPLYRQLSDRLAYLIATGRIPGGTVLPSLRSGQAAWGIHFHTVRRAYHHLRAAGLVEVRERGETVVVAGRDADSNTVRGALAVFLREAEARFNATSVEVLAELKGLIADPVTVSVVECSETLASSIGRELASAWSVTPVPRLLSGEWDPEAVVVSTYFHAGEIQRRMSGLPVMLAHVHLRLSPRFVREVAMAVRKGSIRRLAICDAELGFAQLIAGELRQVIGPSEGIGIHAPIDITQFLDLAERDALKLISPGYWDALGKERREAPDVALLEFRVDPTDLAALGPRLGWRRRSPVAVM